MSIVVETTETTTNVSTTQNIAQLDTALEDVVVNTTTSITQVSVSPYVIEYGSGGSGNVATDAIFDALGDLVVGTGANTSARLPLGTNGQVLTVDTTQSTGLKYAATAGGGVGSVWSLTNSTSVGATTAELDITPDANVLVAGDFVLVGLGLATAEAKKVSTTPTTSTVTFTTSFAYAHSADEGVLVIRNGLITPTMFACKGDGTTTDHNGTSNTALQNAIVQAAKTGLTLDGQGKAYVHSSPLALCNSANLVRFNPKLAGSFTPADADGSAWPGQNGSILTFTVDAATDTLTTPSAHGAGGARCIVQGPSLPPELVAGRFYYAVNSAGSTLQLSATSGGSPINLSAGSGTIFCEVYSSNQKSNMAFCTFEGSLVAGVNGPMLSIQQQSNWQKIRVNNCPGHGVRWVGQQAEVWDLEIINCGDSLVYDNMSFAYLKDFNAEQFSSSAFKVTSGGCHSCLFSGGHFESRDAAGVFVDGTAGRIFNTLFDCFSMSGFDTNNAAWVGFDFGNSANHSYDIRSVYFPQGTPSATSAMALRDTWAGTTIHVWNDAGGASCNRRIGRVYRPAAPSSFVYLDEFGGESVFGPGGRYFRIGSQTNSLPWAVAAAGSSLTGDLWQWRDGSGNTQIQITKDAWLKIGAGAAIKKVLSATATWDPASLADGAVATTTVTVTGATVTNSVARASLSTITAVGWIISAMVTAADTVAVTIMNKTGGTVDLGSGTLRVAVTQF